MARDRPAATDTRLRQLARGCVGGGPTRRGRRARPTATTVAPPPRAPLARADHIAAPVARVVILAGLLASYPYLWEQGAALTNQLTDLILSPAPVITGINKLMAYAVDGVAL